MKTHKYQLIVKGLQSGDGTISVRSLLELLQQFTACAERGLRLAIEGQSVRRGVLPAWIERSTELVFTGLQKGSTILDFEAPVLGETIGDLLSQQDFWVHPPDPDDTAFSIVAKMVGDTTAENLESDYYDAGVLSSLLDLKHFFSAKAQTVELIAPGRAGENFILNMPLIEKVERLKIRTPESQAFVVSGHLDQIRHSRRNFVLVVGDGQTIPGCIDEEFMSVEELRQLWGRKVSVKGIVHFKPSGHVRLLEAHLLKPMEDGEEIFAVTPHAQTEAEFVREITTISERRDWLKDIWGKWPGEEPIEELVAGLYR